MVVNKFYALYAKKDGSNEIVDVYQAIKLVYEDAVVFTKPKELCSLYDLETYLKVTPVRGVTPYFKYYPDEDSPLLGRTSSLEYTLELKTFIRAFEKIKLFKIEEYNEPPIVILPNKMKKLQRIDTSESFVVLKFLVELKETKPYSHYYKFNGNLGLEFTVTSEPEPIKGKELGLKGIPLFRSKIKFPEWIEVPEEFNNVEEFETVATEIRNTYQTRNYRLQGEFINNAINFPEYKEKYKILSEFERQCEELRKEKYQYEQAIERKKIQLATMEEKKEKQQQELNKERQQLEKFRSEIEHYEKIRDDNKLLLKEASNLKEQINQLRIDNSILKKEEHQLNISLIDANNNLNTAKNDLSNAKEQLQEYENKGFFKNLFSRKSK